MERIDFQPADAVLEEDGAETEVGVRVDASVFLGVDCLLCNGHVVQNAELGVRSLHVVVEESGREVKNQAQCSEDFKRKFVTSLESLLKSCEGFLECEAYSLGRSCP